VTEIPNTKTSISQIRNGAVKQVWQHNDQHTSKQDKSKLQEERVVDTDMEALRQAQAFGITAGADVTI